MKEAIKPGPVERFQIKWEPAYVMVDVIINKKPNAEIVPLPKWE